MAETQSLLGDWRVYQFEELQIEHAAAIEQNAITFLRLDLVSTIQEQKVSFAINTNPNIHRFDSCYFPSL
jgi:hypothetical protein